jgi:hypothetical protein
MRETITADVQREQVSAVAIGSSHETAYALMAPTLPLRQRLASSTRHASPRGQTSVLSAWRLPATVGRHAGVG